MASTVWTFIEDPENNFVTYIFFMDGNNVRYTSLSENSEFLGGFAEGTYTYEPPKVVMKIKSKTLTGTIDGGIMTMNGNEYIRNDVSGFDTDF